MLYYNYTYTYKCFHATYHIGDEGKLSMGTLLGTVGPFNPDTDDWVVYSQRLEQFFKANGVEKQRAVLLSVCGNETYVLISPNERGGGGGGGQNPRARAFRATPFISHEARPWSIMNGLVAN